MKKNHFITGMLISLIFCMISFAGIEKTLTEDLFPANIRVNASAPLIEQIRLNYPVDLLGDGFIDLFVTYQEYLQLVHEFDIFLQSGEIQITMRQTNQQAMENFNTRLGDRGYHSYNTMLSELQSLESSYPTICKLYNLGTSSSSSYSLWGLKISDNVAIEEDEPSTFLCGAIHGNEKPGPEVVIYTINHIISKYNSDSAITHLVNNTQLWFVPMVNPWGHVNNTRYNANGVDLNRDWPTSWTYAEPLAQAETNVIINNFLKKHHFVAGVDYHTYGKLTMTPWAYTSAYTADHSAIYGLAQEMASSSGHSVGTINYFMGTVNGSSVDYEYGFFGIFAYGVELGTSHSPTVAVMEQICQTELNAALLVLKRVHRATVTGIVTNAQTGQPLAATIHVNEIDKTDKCNPFLSDTQYGRYYRLLPTGSYTFTISASGFITQTKTNIATNSTSQTILNIALIPEGGDCPVPAANFTFSSNQGTAVFTDSSTCTYPITAWNWTFGDGSQSTVKNPTYIYTASGTYPVTLTVTNSCGKSGSKTQNIVITIDSSSDRNDVVGSFSNGIWTRNSDTGVWVQWSKNLADIIRTGDLNNDGQEDIIVFFDNLNQLWYRYSHNGQWEKIQAKADTLVCFDTADFNQDGNADLLGSWDIGLWWRDSATASWYKLSAMSPTFLAAGDFNGNGQSDLVGLFPSLGEIWIRYDNGLWEKISKMINLTDLRCGDIDQDGIDEIIGSWDNGVWSYDPVSKQWIRHHQQPATELAIGDINGDEMADIAGYWDSPAGLWVKYSHNGVWEKLSNLMPITVDIGKLR
jgi:PKD repeat protein